MVPKRENMSFVGSRQRPEIHTQPHRQGRFSELCRQCRGGLKGWSLEKVAMRAWACRSWQTLARVREANSRWPECRVQMLTKGGEGQIHCQSERLPR